MIQKSFYFLIFVILNASMVGVVLAQQGDNAAQGQLEQKYEVLIEDMAGVHNEIAALKDSSEIAAMQKTVGILEKTNAALEQRWTPINVVVSILAAFFSVITILWGIVFAFGYIALQQIRQHKKAMFQELQDIRKKSSQLYKSVEKESESILEQAKDKKKSTVAIAKEIAELKEKTKQQIEQLENKTFITASGVSASPYPLEIMDSWSTPRVRFPSLNVADNLSALQTCSRCGTVFVAIDTLSSSHLLAPLTLVYTKPAASLCRRCLEEDEQKKGDTLGAG